MPIPVSVQLRLKMPLVRFAVRNEYGLGMSELHNDAVQDEDPKAVLDGIAVAGLVGILRQLGDLAEFAVEIFHGLQEQVASTASRSHKLVTRVQLVEASLSQLEKAILSQTSHIHYAYTPGFEWHVRIRNDQNHFIFNDLPHFIMDSYEECREPPCLQWLDRFDTGAPGSCLKRYSDPTFFRRASANSQVPNGEKSLRERKARKIKRRRSWKQGGHFRNWAPTLNASGRMEPLSPTVQGQSSLNTRSTFDTTFKSDHGHQSDSLDSKDGRDFIECVFHPSTSIQHDNAKTIELSSGLDEELMVNDHNYYLNERTAIGGACSPVMETTFTRSSSVMWDLKTEIVSRVGPNYGINDIEYVPETNSYLDGQDMKPANDLSENGSPLKSNAIVDDIQDEPKENFELDDLFEHGSTPKFHVDGDYPNNTIDGSFMEPSQMTELDNGIDDVQHVLENFELHEHDSTLANVECITQVANLYGGENTSESIDNANPISEVRHVLDTNFDIAERELEAIQDVCQVDAFPEGGNAVTVIEWNQLDDIESETDHYVDALNTIESESESDFESQTRKEIVLFSNPKDGLIENTINKQKAEQECHSLSYDHEKSLDDSQHSTALVSSTNMESPVLVQSSCKESAEGQKVDDSASLSHEQSVQCIQSSSINIPQGIDFCAIKPSAHEISTSGSRVPPAEDTIHTPHLAREMPVLSSTYPHAFWTNGSLLGLAPSKPTVFSMSNAVNFDPMGSVNNITVGHSNPNIMQKVDGSVVLVSSDKGPKLDNEDQHDGFSNHMSCDQDQSDLSDHGLINGNIMPHETRVPTAVNVGEAINAGEDLKGQLNSPVNSPPPSPPLEHMNISFRPMDGFEASRLKLKYPEGVDHHEISVDTFPTFQLVPKSSNLKQNLGSDSDDDTFCQSYAAMSDDDLSHLSDSNSEEWESGDTSESNDNALYDGLQRISSRESTSSSPQHSESGPSYVPPILDTKNPFSYQEMKLCLNTEVDSSHFQQPTPPTPPLPPLQWRVSRPLLDAGGQKQDQGFNSLYQSLNPKLSGSSITHLAKVGSAKLPSQSEESATVTKTHKLHEKKLDPQNQNYQVTNGKREDEREDFLYQIQTKSFNLRRTKPAQSTSTSSFVVNNKVTAILQKANAIRRAVGSDGDDDSWSDT